MRGGGSQAAASRVIRCHVMRVFWLRRRSVRRHRFVTWCRNASSALALVGTAWYAKKPVTTAFSHRPCSGMGCMRSRSSALISRSFALWPVSTTESAGQPNCRQPDSFTSNRAVCITAVGRDRQFARKGSSRRISETARRQSGVSSTLYSCRSVQRWWPNRTSP
jgi:hypothetical protein